MTENQSDKIKQEINKAINFLGQNKFDEALLRLENMYLDNHVDM